MNPDQVHSVAFSNPPIARRGYNQDEVDAFLDHVEAALRNPAGRTLTAEDVRNVVFSKPPVGCRGYNEGEVDAFLDVVEQQMKPQRGALPPPPTGPLPAKHAAGVQTQAGRFMDGVIAIFSLVVSPLRN